MKLPAYYTYLMSHAARPNDEIRDAFVASAAGSKDRT
jgi:hypothetical protein